MKWYFLIFMLLPAARAGEPPTATKSWSAHDCDSAKVDTTVANWAESTCGNRVVDATSRKKLGPHANGQCDVSASVWCGAAKPVPPPPPPSIPSNCNPPFVGVADQYLSPQAMVFRDENCGSRGAGQYWPLTDPRFYTDLRYEERGVEEPWKHDGISSLYVKDGWRISIFENVGYGGKVWTICGPMQMLNLRSFGNDSVSSLVVGPLDATSPGCEPGSINDRYIGPPLPPAPADCHPPFSGMDSNYANPGAMLFQNEGCAGRSPGEYWPLTDALAYPDLKQNGKNDWASAVSVKAGWRLEIYQHVNYNRNQGESDGESWTICGPVALGDLRAFTNNPQSSGNDTVSSMIVSTGDAMECEPGHVYEGTPFKKDRAAIPLFGQ